jgi:hypothetical protein
MLEGQERRVDQNFGWGVEVIVAVGRGLVARL